MTSDQRTMISHNTYVVRSQKTKVEAELLGSRNETWGESHDQRASATHSCSQPMSTSFPPWLCYWYKQLIQLGVKGSSEFCQQEEPRRGVGTFCF